MLEALDRVSVADLNRVGVKYVAPLFDPKRVKAALITDPAKVNEAAEGFKRSVDLFVVCNQYFGNSSTDYNYSF